MARLSYVLVIDADPQGLSTVAYGFEREGCRVATAASFDAASSVLQAQAPRPDVVVMTLRQDAKASRLVVEAILRQHLPPVILLGTQAHLEGLGTSDLSAGPDFLIMPAYLRDILTATRLRAAVRPTNATAESTVQAALSEFGLFFLLRTLVALRASAVVQLERANRKGELKFSKGELRSAQVGTLTGPAALNQMLLWEEAALEVRFRSVTARSQFNTKGNALIEDAERFLRDFAHTAKGLGSAQTIYELAHPDRLDAQPEVASVLRLFDGQRSISDVIDESPFRVFDTLRIIARFVDTETIRRRTDVESRPLVSTSAASPLMEAWLRGETDRERVEPASPDPIPQAHVTHAGGTGPLPQPEPPPEAPREPSPAVPVNRSAMAGALEARSTRGELLAKSSGDKAVQTRPSMVIDLPPELLDVEARASANAPDHTPWAPAAAPRAYAPAPRASTPAPAPRAAEPAPTQPAPIVRPPPQAAEANPFAPRRPALSSSMLGRPSPSATSFASAALAPPSGSADRGHPPSRTTGTMEVPTSQRPTSSGARATGSIELDPDLMAEMETRNPASLTPPVVVAPPMVQPMRSPAGPVGGPHVAKTRTGEFDQLEKDFFAREKDLYKGDHHDNFDDLE